MWLLTPRFMYAARPRPVSDGHQTPPAVVALRLRRMVIEMRWKRRRLSLLFLLSLLTLFL